MRGFSGGKGGWGRNCLPALLSALREFYGHGETGGLGTDMGMGLLPRAWWWDSMTPDSGLFSDHSSPNSQKKASQHKLLKGRKDRYYPPLSWDHSPSRTSPSPGRRPPGRWCWVGGFVCLRTSLPMNFLVALEQFCLLPKPAFVSSFLGGTWPKFLGGISPSLIFSLHLPRQNRDRFSFFLHDRRVYEKAGMARISFFCCISQNGVETPLKEACDFYFLAGLFAFS